MGRFWTPRRLDFGDFSKVFRSCWPVRSKKRRHTKNLQKPLVFIIFSHVRPCAHASKNNKKSLRTVFSSELRNRSLAERSFFELVSVKMVPEGSPERLERRLGTLLDALGAPLGRSWAPLGRSWVPLGRSWASHFSGFFQNLPKKLKNCHLQGSWTALGRPPDDQTSIFDPPRVDFDPPGDDFKAFPSSNSIAKLEQSLGKIMAKSMRKP